MLHVLNGDSARMGIERSGIPGVFVVWPDVLYEGPTPLATGEEWIAVRTAYLAGVADRPIDDVAERYRQNDAILESFRDHDEVVFWFEHDLFDQLLLIRHLWWLRTRSLRRREGGREDELDEAESRVPRDVPRTVEARSISAAVRRPAANHGRPARSRIARVDGVLRKRSVATAAVRGNGLTGSAVSRARVVAFS